jgi:peptidoglycan/LPS O-acetylase OafA/YrhL
MSALSFLLRGPQTDLTDPETPNSFDALRFFAATAVLVSHAWPLTGRKPEPMPGNWDTLGGVGVGIFFVISGFLVAASRERSATLGSFAHKRALRILPAFTFVCLLSVFVLGPLVTAFPLDIYFDHAQTRMYFANLTMFDVQLALPGVFDRNAYPYAVNGSTWTLPIECFMYVVLGIAAVALLHRWVLPALVVTGFVLYHLYGLEWASSGAHLWPTLPAYFTLKMGIFFALGTCAYVWRDRLPLSPLAAAVLWIVAVLMQRTPYAVVPYMLALAYSTLVVAALPWSVLTEWGRFGDFSYGMYLFAFPVQQAIVHYAGPALPLPLDIAMCFAVTLLFAIASWHLVERPALALKSTAHLAGHV